jgi:hypothetical protein
MLLAKPVSRTVKNKTLGALVCLSCSPFLIIWLGFLLFDPQNATIYNVVILFWSFLCSMWSSAKATRNKFFLFQTAFPKYPWHAVTPRRSKPLLQATCSLTLDNGRNPKISELSVVWHVCDNGRNRKISKVLFVRQCDTTNEHNRAVLLTLDFSMVWRSVSWEI